MNHCITEYENEEIRRITENKREREINRIRSSRDKNASENKIRIEIEKQE